MINTYEEYIKLLELELKNHGFSPLNDTDIIAFIKKHQLDKCQGISVFDVKSDIKTLINLHNQGKTAFSAIQNGQKQGQQTSYRQNTNIAKTNNTRGQLVGASGKTYLIDSKAFSSGGEGDIYRIIGDDSQVIKIYHYDRISSELEDKLCYMSKNPPSSSVLNQVAWPMDVVYDESKKFKGFVMPKLDITAELGDVYVYPPSRPESKIAYNYKLILAMNICTVINAVHNAGYVFGDFNPRNIGINMKTGKVAFLDTDSYHIVLNEAANKAYRCKVCLDGYVAPELLKRCEPYKKDAYENAPLPTFTKETDNFALAIHIFKLLMNGYTPFNGIKENETASTSSPGIGNQAIKRDSYCFKRGNKPQAVAVPPADILPANIKKLFDRAFVDGKNDPQKRPNAKEWYSALTDYEKSLVVCSKNHAHLYKKGLRTCPWCAADEKYEHSINPPLTQKTFPKPVTLAGATTTTSSSYSTNPLQQTSANAKVTNATNKSTQKKAKLSAEEKKKRIASIIYPISWILFLLNICLCLAPFVRNGSFSFDQSIVWSYNYNSYFITSIVSTALLCFSTNLKYSSSLGLVFSWIWAAIASIGIATIRYTQMGFNSSSASKTWKIFGMLIVAFVVTILGSAALGNKVRQGTNSTRTNQKPKFRPFDVIFLIILVVVASFCIPLLLNLSQLYSLVSNYNLFSIGIWVVPVILFIMFATSHSGNEIVGSWFCATEALLFDCLVLRLGAFNSTEAILLWLVLAILALLFIAYIQSEIDNPISLITTISLFVFFIAGAFADLSSILGSGVNSVGEGAQWWSIAPAIIDAIAATVYSGYLLFRK